MILFSRWALDVGHQKSLKMEVLIKLFQYLAFGIQRLKMIKYQFWIWLLPLCLMASACSPKLKSRFLTRQDVLWQTQAAEAPIDPFRISLQSGCYNYEAYIPDTARLEHTPIKYVRVNFHWMNAADSSKNYHGQAAIDYTYELLRAINADLENNRKMWLPHGNETSALPTRYRFVLTPRAGDSKDLGIYCHFDDQLCYYIHKGRYANLLRREVFDRYGVQLDTVLNIFIMPHHPDSVRSKTYHAGGVGVALGNAIKAAGMYEQQGPPEQYSGIFNHEIGHIFNLAHAWLPDGCDDTPEHPNLCWTWTPEPPCDTMASNNLMDYNAYQHAWTPCQIGKIHYAMAQEELFGRQFLQPNWCVLRDEAHIVIRDTVEWRGAKDLEGHLTIAPGGHLTIHCRVSLPAYAKITVQPGATLMLTANARLHNACGNRWLGIEVQSLGKTQGQVIMIGTPSIENLLNPLD